MKSSNITRAVQKPFTAHRVGKYIMCMSPSGLSLTSQCLDAHLGSPVVVSLVAGVADLVEAVHSRDVF